MANRSGIVGLGVGIAAGVLGARAWSVLTHVPGDVVVAVSDPGQVEARPTGGAALAVEPQRAAAALSAAGPGALESARDDLDDVAQDGGAALVNDALRAHAESGIASGWAELRTDPIPADRAAEGLAEFEGLVRDEPRRIGRRLAELQTKRDAAEGRFATEDPIRLLRALAEPGVGPVPSLVRDAERFAALYRREHATSFVDGTGLGARPDDALGHGAVVTFPAGVFLVDHLMDHADPFPDEVTLQGAGVDATLLVIPELYTRSVLRSFAIRDCSVHTDDNYLFDLRTQPATLEFERVRFTGFDIGAGSSCLIGTRETALWMVDCLVEGGYGRSPAYGQLFSIDTPGFVARFDRCVFRRMWMGLGRANEGATLVLSQCKLEDVFDDPEADAEEQAGVFLEDCIVLRYPGRPYEEPPRRDLNDLFPGWRAALERR